MLQDIFRLKYRDELQRVIKARIQDALVLMPDWCVGMITAVISKICLSHEMKPSTEMPEVLSDEIHSGQDRAGGLLVHSTGSVVEQPWPVPRSGAEMLSIRLRSSRRWG